MMLPDAAVPDSTRCWQMLVLPEISRCCHMIPDAADDPRCCQVLPAQMLPDAAKCYQVLPDAPRYSRCHRIIQDAARCWLVLPIPTPTPMPIPNANTNDYKFQRQPQHPHQYPCTSLPSWRTRRILGDTSGRGSCTKRLGTEAKVA